MKIDRRTLLRTAPAAAAASMATGVTDAAPPTPVTPPGALVPPDPGLHTPAPASAAAAVSSAARPIATPVAAPETETIRLWPGDPPGAPATPPAPRLHASDTKGGRDVTLRGVAAPVMFVYRPTNPSGVGLLVMPGGGYASLSLQNEGANVTRVFTARGWTVFVLSYRLPGEGWTPRADAPLQDAIRAMRLVRARAPALGVDAGRIGVLGFSAGGHLAASLATRADPGPDAALYAPVDAADAQPAAPRFVGLAYAVTTLAAPCAGGASRRNLLGVDPSPALVARRSPLLHVDRATPPCFVVHALDDPIVDPAAAILWLQACRAARVPVAAQFLETGGHGFGMSLARSNPGAVWPEQFRLWAARHGG